MLFAKFRGVRSDHCKAFKRLTVRNARFDHSKLCKGLAEFQSVRFENRKACRRLAECVLSTLKRVEGLQRY